MRPSPLAVARFQVLFFFAKLALGISLVLSLAFAFSTSPSPSRPPSPSPSPSPVGWPPGKKDNVNRVFLGVGALMEEEEAGGEGCITPPHNTGSHDVRVVEPGLRCPVATQKNPPCPKII